MEKTSVFGSFFLNESEFAISVREIQEVVPFPEKLTRIPLVPEHVLGMFNLRGVMIPVLNPKTLLRLGTGSETYADKKVAVLNLGPTKVGVVFDRTGEIFKSRQEETSEVVNSAIFGAIKLDDGRRIVQLLDAKSLVKIDEIPGIHPSTDDAVTGAALTRRGNRKKCVHFTVGQSQCAFEIERIQEIIRLPEIQPNVFTSGSCLGMFTLRGETVPVFDFEKLLEVAGSTANSAKKDEQRIIILKIADQKIGLRIDALQSIISYHAEEVLSVPPVGKGGSRYFRGCIDNQDAKNLILLDDQALLSNPELAQLAEGHRKIYNRDSSRAAKEKVLGKKRTYIVIRLGDYFAIRIEDVKEIIGFRDELLHPPGLPGHVNGMLNLRGEIVPVINTRRLYAMPDPPEGTSTKILFIEKDRQKLGLVVDSVESIISFSDAEKLQLPRILYERENAALNEDIREAVEIRLQDQAKRTLMILNIESLFGRLILGKSA